ncbi:MAG: hypothetical protein WD058_04000 [Dehalococcoidia bacterium]
MLILRLGLYLAVALALWATWASAGAGYAIEVAMLRGLVAFMALAFVAYLGEIVVMTAPPARRKAVELPAAQAAPEDEDDEDNVPVNLPALRGERSASADDRRAA